MDFRGVIDRLDRRCEYVRQFDGQEFLLELHRLVMDLKSDPVLSSILLNFVNDFSTTMESLRAQNEIDRLTLKRLLPRLLKLHPTWRSELKGRLPTATNIFQAYADGLASLRFVKAVIKGTAQLPQQESFGALTIPDMPEDNAYRIMGDRIQQLLSLDPQQSSEIQELAHDFVKARDRRQHVLDELRLSTPTAPFSALKLLLDLCTALNPDPINSSSLAERVRLLWRIHPGDARWRQEMRQVAFKGDPFPRDEEAHLRKALERLYHHLRLAVDQRRTWNELFDRYCQRAQWYDRQRLRQLGETPRRGEDSLSDDLARFLFDNGVPVLVRHSFGGHVPDLVGPEQAGFVIESKLSKRSCRGQLVSNVAQLLSYLQTLEGTVYSADVGYYLVFRVAGPLYAFDGPVNVGRWVVHPVVVDIGSEGGRARHKVQVIRATEILSHLQDSNISGTRNNDE